MEETKIVKCIDCGNKIEVDKRASPKQCKCDDCRIQTKRIKNLSCLCCNKELKSKRGKFCNQKCQQNFQYKEFIEKWKNGLKESGKSKTSNHIRRYLFEKYNNKCSECGWGKINKFSETLPLEVEHIDGNSENNKEENLNLLCPNCHSLTSTYKGANKGKGRFYRRKRYKEGKSF